MEENRGKKEEINLNPVKSKNKDLIRKSLEEARKISSVQANQGKKVNIQIPKWKRINAEPEHFTYLNGKLIEYSYGDPSCNYDS